MTIPLLALALALLLLGCGPRSSEPRPGPGPLAQPGSVQLGPDGCAVHNAGPLLPIRFDTREPPPMHGGAILDGVYDLTQVVNFGSSKQATRPALRWSMLLRVEDRSSNHVEGSLFESYEEAPDVGCRTRRFMVANGKWRSSLQEKDETVEYTATPNSLTLISYHSFRSSGTGLFFRRRP